MACGCPFLLLGAALRLSSGYRDGEWLKGKDELGYISVRCGLHGILCRIGIADEADKTYTIQKYLLMIIKRM